MTITVENIKSQMRKGILEYCILAILKERESYPTEIIEKLKAADLIVLEGTLYPLLTRLKNANLLTYRWEESNSGPPRKYFSITQYGEVLQLELHKAWQEFSNSINAISQSI